MTRQELEENVGRIARILQDALRQGNGERVGFCLLFFDFGDKGNFAYAANANRADVVRLLKEAREKIGAETQ